MDHIWVATVTFAGIFVRDNNRQRLHATRSMGHLPIVAGNRRHHLAILLTWYHWRHYPLQQSVLGFVGRGVLPQTSGTAFLRGRGHLVGGTQGVSDIFYLRHAFPNFWWQNRRLSAFARRVTGLFKYANGRFYLYAAIRPRRACPAVRT